MSRLPHLALLTALLVGAACSSSNDGDIPPRPITGSALLADSADGSGAISEASSLGTEVFLYTGDRYRAEEDLTLIGARPRQLDDGLTLHETRLLVILKADGSVGARGEPHGICTDEFPPKGYGPAVQLRGARIEKGDLFGVLFYVQGQAERPGDRAARGSVIDYDIGKRRYRQESSGNDLVLHVRARPEDFPPDIPRCPPQASPWFGNLPATSTTSTTARGG